MREQGRELCRMGGCELDSRHRLRRATLCGIELGVELQSTHFPSHIIQTQPVSTFSLFPMPRLDWMIEAFMEKVCVRSLGEGPPMKALFREAESNNIGTDSFKRLQCKGLVAPGS